MNKVISCLQSIARPSLYSREQWFALALSILCVNVGVWAGYQMISESWNHTWPTWLVEAALVLSVSALLWFAFSRYPQESA